MLYEFSQAHQELWCTYLIAGHTKKDDYAIKVVPAKQLEGEDVHLCSGFAFCPYEKITLNAFGALSQM